MPTLHTSRPRLRALGARDVPALFAIYGDAERMRFASDPPNLRSIRLFTHLGFQPLEGALHQLVR